MAKLVMPLMSVEARNKVANSLVFFPWKGIAVVRRWLKPTNPQSDGQGDQRIMMGGTGRAVGMIVAGSVFAQQLITLGLITGYQTKQSYLVKYILDNYLTDLTTYSTQRTAYLAHTSSDAFEAAATTLGIVDFDLDYAAVEAYSKGLGLYLIAKAASALGFTGTPYTTNITAWVTADVNGMINDFTSAT